MSEEEIERIFKEIDKDESGSITKKEAVRACRRFLTFIISSYQYIHNILIIFFLIFPLHYLCFRNSTMAGLEDVEAWLDASDKNGVTLFLNLYYKRGCQSSRWISTFFFQQVSLQTTRSLRVNCIPSIHGWCDVFSIYFVHISNDMF